MLSEQLLGHPARLLAAHPADRIWLFPGPDPIDADHRRDRCSAPSARPPTRPVSTRSVTVHTLRHSFATHLLEQGVDIRVIQDLLGHRHITSTTRYARVALNTIRQIQSPLELLNIEMRRRPDAPDMSRPKLEVADIFRRHGAAWRAANAAHLSLGQRRVMTAIEICRTAALGGHVERCEDCAHTRIAYNSCRNRHCPKCQWTAARGWLEAREAELLPVPYFHVVFTLPAAIGAIAYQNKAKVYGLLFTAAAETLTTIAADPKHLGAEIGVTAVLHTWGQNLDHHPHVHCIVPGGGISPDGDAVGSLPARLLPAGARALAPVPATVPRRSRSAACRRASCSSSPTSRRSNDADAFDAYLAPLRRSEWVVYAKRPFAGPEQVLAYLARYTHRVAIGNSRLIALDDGTRQLPLEGLPRERRHRPRSMTLDGRRVHAPLPAARPARRLPSHPPLRPVRQRPSRRQARALSKAARLLPPTPVQPRCDDRTRRHGEHDEPPPCPCCGGRMKIIETLRARMHAPRSFPRRGRFDTS